MRKKRELIFGYFALTDEHLFKCVKYVDLQAFESSFDIKMDVFFFFEKRLLIKDVEKSGLYDYLKCYPLFSGVLP